MPVVSSKCNICGGIYSAEKIERDSPVCSGCGSTPRIRAVVDVLSDALFGERLPLWDFPSRPDLQGIGLSDWGYADLLAEKLGYRNTFYDREPQLDITDPPGELDGTLDFLISSDVFEHIPPPIERAFEGSFRLLKPGGALILTVPYLPHGPHLEHFPKLNRYEILDFDGEAVLLNRTADGEWEVFDDLVFHDNRYGAGRELRMRIFSHSSLLTHLREAGFSTIDDWKDRFDWPGSFPLVARR